MRTVTWLLAGVFILAAAAPRAEPEQLRRDAYAAFERGDLPLALTLYDRAEQRSTMPARIAFDLAGVQYRQALATADLRMLAEAEQNYRCCLDPADPHRAAALYGLGNCLLARGNGRDIATLMEAFQAYQKCLHEPESSTDLVAAARYNLEKTRLALVQTRTALANAPDIPPGSPDPSPKPPEGMPPPDNPSFDPGERVQGQLANAGEPKALKGDDAKAGHDSNEQPPPGAGNLPPIPDDDQATPLSPHDAAAHLEQATGRIREERQRSLRMKATQSSPAGVRDW